MKITRTSILTNITHEREIDITAEQLFAWKIRNMHIQDAMPNVSAGDREFLMTGITPEEWDAEFGDESDCELGEGQ
jgi:hypothetical protein